MKRISLFLLVLCTIAGLFAAACDDDSNNENNINNVNNSNNTNNVNNLSCGNGLLDEGESCDGTNLNDQTCQSVGSTFIGGTLACNTNCTWDVSGCSTGEEVCGDGAVEGLEVCDGTNLDGVTCVSLGLGFTGGTLSCDSGCLAFDTALCVTAVEECGNGVIESQEACEGTNLNGTTCESLGFLSGTLGCRDDCQFDASQCVSPGCGDTIINGLETCEGSNLGGNDCTTIGQNFVGGDLSCNEFCQFDTSQCETCGNHALNTGETCDGTFVGGQTCVSLGMGFVGGTLGCQSDCSDFDVSQCLEPACGDGSLNGTETCDGTDLGGETCLTVSGGYVSGTLACNSECTDFDVSQCVEPACGDGSLNGTETCDGTDLGGETCLTVGGGYVSGTLLCNGFCDGFDDTGCVLPTCGDGIISGLETCDGTNTNGQTCLTVGGGYVSGTLLCNGICDGFDETGCLLPVCGDNIVTGLETCDGTNVNGETCMDYGHAGGVLVCLGDCSGLDFSGCTD